MTKGQLSAGKELAGLWSEPLWPARLCATHLWSPSSSQTPHSGPTAPLGHFVEPAALGGLGVAWPQRMDESLVPCLMSSLPCRGDPLLPVLRSERKQPLPAGTARPAHGPLCQRALSRPPAPALTGKVEVARCLCFTVVLSWGSALGQPLDQCVSHMRPAPRVWLTRRCCEAGLGWGPRVHISHKLQGEASPRSILSSKKQEASQEA